MKGIPNKFNILLWNKLHHLQYQTSYQERKSTYNTKHIVRSMLILFYVVLFFLVENFVNKIIFFILGLFFILYDVYLLHKFYKEEEKHIVQHWNVHTNVEELCICGHKGKEHLSESNFTDCLYQLDNDNVCDCARFVLRGEEDDKKTKRNTTKTN